METEIKINIELVHNKTVEVLRGKRDEDNIREIVKNKFDRYGVNYFSLTIAKVQYHEDGDYTSFEIWYDYWKMNSYIVDGFEVW